MSAGSGCSPPSPWAGPLEWAHDSDRSWGLQLHLATAAAASTGIHPGTACWHRYDPSLGLERLRELNVAVGQLEGVEFAGDIGATSNTGDLLRRAAISSQLAGPPNARSPSFPPRHVIASALPLVPNITIQA